MATKKNPPAKKTTKSAPKKTVKTTKKAPSREAVSQPVVKTTPETQKGSAFRFKKLYAIIILIAVLLIAALYAMRSYFVAATVNGQPISRFTIINELERQSGKRTLDTMITKELILQEAKKKNIVVTDEQVDQEMKKIEDNLKQQGQSLDQVLALQQMTVESLRDQVRVQKTVELILGNQIAVSEKDIDDYIASNSATLPQEMDPKELRTSISQELRQQKLTTQFETWLNGLRKNAKIEYVVTY